MWLDIALPVRFFVAAPSFLVRTHTESCQCRSSALADAATAAAKEGYRNEMMFFWGTPLPLQQEVNVNFYITPDSDAGSKQIVAIILSVIGALLTGFAYKLQLSKIYYYVPSINFQRAAGGFVISHHKANTDIRNF
ncbi:hypothetical protein Tco_1268588 [Tanacetum coccineum]